VGVSNFGVAHLEALVKLGLDKPSVNQIELHPWQQKKEIVKYCRERDIAVMGYSPLAKGQKVQDKTIVDIAKRSVFHRAWR
jgi:diketogulonate reductase-like aldo/keto reductase